jgi:hypothetical protein
VGAILSRSLGSSQPSIGENYRHWVKLSSSFKGPKKIAFKQKKTILLTLKNIANNAPRAEKSRI